MRKNIIFFIILILFIAITNYWVLSKDKLPPVHDHFVCYHYSLSYFNLLKDFDFSILKFLLFNNINSYPPLYMLIPLPFYIFFGINSDVMAMVNVIYLIILIFSVYRIGSFIRNDYTGFFSAILVSFFPSIIGFSRITHINIALTSIVALSIYLLLKTDTFSNKKFSIIAGLLAGIGVLFSVKYPIYIIGSFLICIIFSLYGKNKKSNILLYFFMAIIICGIFYIPAFFVNLNNPNPKIFILQHIIKNFRIIPYLSNVKAYFNMLKNSILIPNSILFIVSIIFLNKWLFRKKYSLIFLVGFVYQFLYFLCLDLSTLFLSNQDFYYQYYPQLP